MNPRINLGVNSNVNMLKDCSRIHVMDREQSRRSLLLGSLIALHLLLDEVDMQDLLFP